MSQREIKFLNSVIVDMQKKVDDMKIQLEISQANLFGQNVAENNLYVTFLRRTSFSFLLKLTASMRIFY